MLGARSVARAILQQVRTRAQDRFVAIDLLVGKAVAAGAFVRKDATNKPLRIAHAGRPLPREAKLFLAVIIRRKRR